MAFVPKEVIMMEQTWKKEAIADVINLALGAWLFLDLRFRGERANGRCRDDEGRAEPVVLEPAVEHEFERAEEGRNQHEADEIECAPLLLQPLALRGCGLPLAQGQRRHHCRR